MRQPSFVLLAALACGRSAPTPNTTTAAPAEEPPVALNAEPAVQYPPDLYARGVEGDVVLRLFADSVGRLAPESTHVAESSGSAALDSAAVRGVGRLRYAPARRHGLPVPTSFLQTVQFRHPGAVTAPNRPPPSAPRSDSSRVRQGASRTASDSTQPQRVIARPQPDTASAPAAPVKPSVDSTASDSTRARPDSNGAAH
jgi:periplasmic protein TonB